MKRGGCEKGEKLSLFKPREGLESRLYQNSRSKKKFFFLKNKFTTKQFLLLHLFQLVWY